MGQASAFGSPGLYKWWRVAENVGHRMSPRGLKNLPLFPPHCLKFSDLWNWEPLSVSPTFPLPTLPTSMHNGQSGKKVSYSDFSDLEGDLVPIGKHTCLSVSVLETGLFMRASWVNHTYDNGVAMLGARLSLIFPLAVSCHQSPALI